MESVRTIQRMRPPHRSVGPRGELCRAQRASRHAFTLLEVLLSTVILAGALAALSQLSTNGVTAALRTENETLAAVRCQTKLDEILATNLLFQSGQSNEFTGASDWSWLAEISDGPTESLAVLTVTVQRTGARNSETSFSLSRLVARSSILDRDERLAKGDAL